jgi:ADP-heptose:LPS heptosyltransferase
LGVAVYQDAEIDSLKDLDGFAAQVAAMDLVISVSNTTVHFAGALNVPVWTLLSAGLGLLWYWFRDREDSPWYPSMRLLRQQHLGDWGDVIARAAVELRAKAARS